MGRCGPGVIITASTLVAVLAAGCGGTGSSRSTTPGGPAPSRARFGESVLLKPVHGTVSFLLPSASGGLTALTGTRDVPVGTTVDARHGTVEITAATPHGGTDGGTFNDGRFVVEQSRSGDGTVDLKLIDATAASAACGGSAAHPTRHTPFQLGLLLGVAHHGFQTDGQFAAAAVLGTDYGVRNRCDGTLAVDREGVVLVTVYHPHRTITLHTGQTFLAKAP